MKIIKEKIEILPQAQAMRHFIARLPEQHPKKAYLENQLHRKTAGERGESRLRDKFKEFFWEEEFAVLWDIGLAQGEWLVQFDGLLLTKRCAIILDSKNISDDLHFDKETDEFFRVDAAGKELVLDDPIFQLNKNIRFLSRWLQKRKIDLPVAGLIVITSLKSMFRSKPAGGLLCKTYQMNDYLYKILHSHPQESTTLKINKIKKLIEAHHTPYVRQPLCKVYQIDYKDLRKGIYCAVCKCYAVRRDNRNWICRDCRAKNAAAHHFALQEYFTFVDDTITNRDLRDFCMLESADVATKLLRQYDFVITGENKARRYRLKQ